MGNYGERSYNPDGHEAEVKAFGMPSGVETMPNAEFRERYPYIPVDPEHIKAERETAREDVRRATVPRVLIEGLPAKGGPTKPIAHLAGMLRYYVAQGLPKGLDAHFFTSVHTILDHRYKTDAFIDIVAVDPQSGERTILGTITYDCSKIDKGTISLDRADVEFQFNPEDIDHKLEKERFKEKVDYIVGLTMDVIESKQILTMQEQ